MPVFDSVVRQPDEFRREDDAGQVAVLTGFPDEKLISPFLRNKMKQLKNIKRQSRCNQTINKPRATTKIARPKLDRFVDLFL